MGRNRSWGTGLVVGMALVGVVACEPEPLPPPGEGSVLVGCDRAGERVQVTVTSHLDPACDYTRGLDVTASDVTLDCQGAAIRTTGTPGGSGILVSTPIDTPLHDVTIRNCHVEGGFTNSLRVTRVGFRTLPEGVEYENGTSDIVIERSTFRGSRGVGVFVDGYVEGVTIRDSQVHGAGSSGIYLETGSRRSRVEGNVIVDNGYRENGPGGQPFTFAGVDLWFWGIGREGISVDGSYENTIVGNAFHGNSAGGIFLYKNCGEYPERPQYFERRYPSEHNLIEGNEFFGGTNGVWIGSRMGENTLPMSCTDEAYVDEPLRRMVLDRADDNTVRANRFHDVVYGIRVEDDGNTVEANVFTGAGPDRHAVVVGTPLRTTVLERPVTGTQLVDNVADIAGNPDPYRWVTGHASTVDSGNLADGAPAPLCEGVEPPRSPFVFVIAVAPAGPGGGPPAETPDLTLPVLGPLPPCVR
ncbi:MAG TPA: right-handed parallel beta-helix repeat-containing protein [Acidimicrobiales bacterium]|nr:right-handed parallel beta-helix repeat-containing protein [Acidimicrobiales bacterium]